MKRINMAVLIGCAVATLPAAAQEIPDYSYTAQPDTATLHSAIDFSDYTAVPPDSTEVHLSLAECLAEGLQNNYDILIEKNLQQISDNDATLGNAGALPTVDLSAGYSGTVDNTKQHLRAGGDVAEGTVHNSALDAEVDLGWTIFEGFNVKTTYQRLRQMKQMGELNTRMAIEDFIAQFASEYYTYVRQYIRLNNLTYAVQLSQERLRIVEARYEIGSMSRLDLQQANVDLNSDRSQLIKQYETMHTMRTQLNRLMANPEVEFHIAAADSVIEFDPSLDRANIESKMMADNTELLAARKGETISGLDLKIVESARYPYVRFNAGYGYTRDWYGSGTYDHRRNLGLDYGITVGINIFDGLNQRRRERNAAIDVKNSKLAYANAELGLKKSLSDTWMAYQNNIRLTNLERDNLSTARENYDIAMERYRLGQLSGIELREAQNSLLEAGERLVQALLDTKLSEITLVYLSGQSISYLLN